MSETTQVQKPEKYYELTVRDFFAYVEGKLWQMPVVKAITVNPNENIQSIHASGAVYDIVSTVGEPQFDIDAVMLPREFCDWADGAIVNGAAAADVSNPIKPMFACGYVCENSDGSQTYYYHPQCKLTMSGSTEHRTSTNTPNDPSVKRTVRIIPTDGEHLWRARYYTRGVAAPMTAEAFFAAKPDTLDKIKALDAGN